MTDDHAYFVDSQWGWRERLWAKLLPTNYCSLPEAPATYQDCVVCRTVVGLSFVDRVRVLLTGYLIVDTKTVTENIVGDTRTSSIAYPARKPKPLKFALDAVERTMRPLK